MKQELLDELENLSYEIRQVTALMSILNVAIDYNEEADNKLYLINFSEIIENKLIFLTDRMDIFSSRLWKEKNN